MLIWARSRENVAGWMDKKYQVIQERMTKQQMFELGYSGGAIQITDETSKGGAKAI